MAGRAGDPGGGDGKKKINGESRPVGCQSRASTLPPVCSLSTHGGKRSAVSLGVSRGGPPGLSPTPGRRSLPHPLPFPLVPPAVPPGNVRAPPHRGGCTIDFFALFR